MGVRAATRFLDGFSAKIVDFGPKPWCSNPFRRNYYGGSAPKGVPNRPFSYISVFFADSSRIIFGAILMEVRLQSGPKPSIFVDFSDFGGFLSIPILTKIIKITVLEQLS